MSAEPVFALPAEAPPIACEYFAMCATPAVAFVHYRFTDDYIPTCLKHVHFAGHEVTPETPIAELVTVPGYNDEPVAT